MVSTFCWFMESRVRNRKRDDVSAPPRSAEGAADDVIIDAKKIITYYSIFGGTRHICPTVNF